MSKSKYYEVCAHIKCMSCEKCMFNIDLNILEKQNRPLGDVSYLPKENDRITYHKCTFCNDFTVCDIIYIRTIKIKTYNDSVTLVGDVQ